MHVIECQTASRKAPCHHVCGDAARVILGPEGALLVVADGLSSEDDPERSRVWADRVLEGVTGFQPTSNPEDVLDWLVEQMPVGAGLQPAGVAVLVARVLLNGEVVCSWCGDVRAYTSDVSGHLTSVTEPHRRDGVIASYVGGDCACVSTVSLTIGEGETLLVVTDGVWEFLGALRGSAWSASGGSGLAQHLVDWASALGHDDCAAAMARLVA